VRQCFAQTPRWTEQKANAWYAQRPWLVGTNYVPKSAINQLEMWQQETFDPVEIDKEFSRAEGRFRAFTIPVGCRGRASGCNSISASASICARRDRRVCERRSRPGVGRLERTWADNAGSYAKEELKDKTAGGETFAAGVRVGA